MIDRHTLAELIGRTPERLSAMRREWDIPDPDVYLTTGKRGRPRELWRPETVVRWFARRAATVAATRRGVRPRPHRREHATGQHSRRNSEAVCLEL